MISKSFDFNYFFNFSDDKNKKESDKVDRIVDEMGHQITKVREVFVLLQNSEPYIDGAGTEPDHAIRTTVRGWIIIENRSSSLSRGDGFSDRSRSSLPSSSPLLQRPSSSASRRHHLRRHSAPLLWLLGSESIISSVIISTSPASASFILIESASSSPPSLSSVAAASRIGVDHFFRHHLHFSSVGIVHPRRVGVIISAVTQIRCCGNQRNPLPSAVKVLKEMLLRFTLAPKESNYFVVSKQLELEISLTSFSLCTMEVLCVCGQWRSKDAFQWEFHVDLNRNASFISIEEDLQFEDLMKIASEDFKEE
ncbi:hypothetical protein YC2023_049766 [Brassica napus]